MRFFILLAATALLIISCNKDIVVYEEWDFVQDTWVHGDKKTMTIPAPDTTSNYKLDLLVRHTVDYPYQNFYIRTVTTYPSGKEVASVTSLELANKDGTWAGDCSGDDCYLELPLQRKFTFPESGDYTWSVEPYMRVDTIEGIRSLTVVCRKSS